MNRRTWYHARPYPLTRLGVDNTGYLLTVLSVPKWRGISQVRIEAVLSLVVCVMSTYTMNKIMSSTFPLDQQTNLLSVDRSQGVHFLISAMRMMYYSIYVNIGY